MSNRIGIDKKYKPQRTPARWVMTYRAWRRNAIHAAGEVWSDKYYSERHQLDTFHMLNRR